MKEYKLVEKSELTEKHLLLAPWLEEGWIDDYDLHLFYLEDGVPVRYISSDGGEPEDSSFRRDWAWVESELNFALSQ